MIYIKGEKIHTNNRCAFVCLRFLLKSWHEAQFTRNHRNSACCLLTALRMSGYWEPWQCPARPCSTEPQLPAAAVWSRLGAARRGVLPPAGQRGLELFPIVVVNVSRRTRLHLQQSAATPADEASLTGQSWEHQGAHRRLRWPRGRVHGERKEVRGPADIPGSDFPPAAGDDGDVQGRAAGPTSAKQQNIDGPIRKVKTSTVRQRSPFRVLFIYLYFFNLQLNHQHKTCCVQYSAALTLLFIALTWTERARLIKIRLYLTILNVCVKSVESHRSSYLRWNTFGLDMSCILHRQLYIFFLDYESLYLWYLLINVSATSIFCCARERHISIFLIKN